MRRSIALVMVLASLGLGGTALAARRERNLGARLVETLQRELGLTRSAAEIQRGLTALDREQASLQYTVALLEHAGAESMRRLGAYAESLDDRELRMRARGRALYKLARGGAARLAFGEPLGEDQPGATAARLARARSLRELVRHDLHELTSHRRARLRARAELLAATREEQALAAAASVLVIETAVLEQAAVALDPRLAEAARARTVALRRAGSRARTAERELIAEVKASAQGLDELRGVAGGPRRVRPVRGVVVGSFGRYLDRVLAVPMRRNGIELAATRDEPVLAIAPGRVVLVTELPELGGAVVIDHGEGEYTLTARLWKIDVAVGDVVDGGRELARAAPKSIDDGLGRTVYFELRHGERPVDPEPYLQRPRVQPKPTAAAEAPEDVVATDGVADAIEPPAAQPGGDG